MKLRTKLNIALIAVFVPGFIASVVITQQLLLRNAKEEVERNAGLMMETAMAVRSYTVEQIKPRLDPLLATSTEFIPETVPAFSAVETFERIRKKYPDYSYREATLNPTNPRDRATLWEERIVRDYQEERAANEVRGEIERNGRRFLYAARPVKISNPACLACHSLPENAPASLRAKYGDVNGFGWQINQVVAAQVVTVPVEVAYSNAREALVAFVGVLAVLFAVLFIVLNIMISRLVVKPLQHVCQVTDEISRGNLSAPEFREDGAHEIQQLHAAFNRMRRSVEKAMKLLKR